MAKVTVREAGHDLWLDLQVEAKCRTSTEVIELERAVRAAIRTAVEKLGHTVKESQ